MFSNPIFNLDTMDKVLVLFTLVYMLFSCNESEKETHSGNDINSKVEDTPSVVKTIVPKIYAIDSLSRETLQRVRSLRWEKSSNAGSSFHEVTAFINADEFPLKISEYFSEPGSGKEGEHFFYFESNELIAVSSLYDEWIDSNTMQVVEQQHFFENGTVVFSRSKSASFLDELQDKKWEKIRAEAPTIDRAYNILRSEPPFTTTFISFIQGDESLFILLGEPKEEDRFITALKIESKDPILEKLYNSPEEYKYTPLKITFEVTGGNNQPEFRVLKNIEMVD